MNLKKLLKVLKLNEASVSMVLGIVVIVIAGVFAINYFKNPREGKVVPGNQTAEEIKPEVGKTYTVKTGDSLWKIAEEAYNSGYNWVDIAEENNLSNANIITEGQELSLPLVTSKKDTTSQMAAVVESVDTTTKGINESAYTVVKGDCLWQIAVRAYGDGYKWVDIAKANGLVHPDLIHPGNQLTLPR